MKNHKSVQAQADELIKLGEELRAKNPTWKREYRILPARGGFSVEESQIFTDGTTGWKQVFWSTNHKLATEAKNRREQ